MKRSIHIAREPNFQKIIISSAVLHLLFITLIAIPFKTKEREYKSYFVNLVTPTQIQRAPKGTTSIKKKKRVKAKPTPRRRVKPKKGVSLESAERLTKEIERLRAISTLEKLKKKKEEEIAKAEESEEAIAEAIEDIRKRKIISLSKAPGIPSNVTAIDSESYYAIITQKIWSEWIYPDFDSSDLEVVIAIRIDYEGNVVSQMIEKSSGNAIFDRSATNAISKASPLPPPPVEMELGVRFYL